MTAISNSDATAALQANLDTVRQRIAAACQRANRDPAEIRLLPVSKTVDEARLRAIHSLGITQLGENKVQEAQSKWEEMEDVADLRWVLIGHLQTNKAKHAARFISEFQALHTTRLAETLDRRLQMEGRAIDVLVQVNTSGEDSKFGLAPDEVIDFVRTLPAYSSLRVRGLMTLALFSPDESLVRPCFMRLRELRDRLRQEAPDGIVMDELSMGMSGDFEMAIEEGATTVRVGTAIFGTRDTPDSDYWPGFAGKKPGA